MNDVNDEFENKSSKRLSFKFWIIVVLLCAFLGFFLSNARKNYNNTNKNNNQNKEELGANITLHFDKDVNTIALDNFNPTKDYLGRSTAVEKCFDFNVDIHLKQSKHVTYELSLKKDESSTIQDDNVHIYLEKKSSSDSYEAVFEPKPFSGETASTKVGTPAGSMVLNTLSVTDSGKDYYRLRMWLTDTSTVTSGIYKLEVVLNAIAD